MFTSMDKALTAAIMGGLYVANSLFGWNFALDPATTTVIIGALTPILVWLVPNKKIVV